MSEGGTLAAAVEGASVGRWQRELAEAIRDPAELRALLGLPSVPAPAAAKSFPLLVPRGFAALMRRGDPADPLLRQVLPHGDEDLPQPPGFSDDPLSEEGCAPAPGLLRKYRSRALLVTTGACAVHCRYCFRRHFAYDELPRGPRWWTAAIANLRADTSVSELILSGGDPLTLPDAQLAELVAAVAEIPHLTRLRVHTRLPVVLPSRVDGGLLAWLAGTRLAPVLVIHANHPTELSPAVAAACARLRSAGVTVLNQAVLLAGVNDDVEVLVALSEGLFAIGVLPYYLHALDRVAGAAHFMVEENRAREIHRALAARLSGYLVPRLVREEPGAAGKTPLV